MADDQNPFTMMGMLQMMQPNKYVDPAYKDKALPMPGYVGTAFGGSPGPTDAMGKPIKSYQNTQKLSDAWNAANPAQPAQGTTLNSNNLGLEAQGSQGRAMQDSGYGNWAMLDPLMAQTSRPNPTAGAGSVGATSGWNPNNSQSIYPTSAGGAAGALGGGGSTTAAQPPQQNPYDMRQAYLTALSDPQGGRGMKTPGAAVPQAQPLGTPSVLNTFLAAHPGGGTAAPAGGGYGNAGFFDTLNKLRSA